MNDSATVGLFRGTAWYYARYRPGYPPALFQHLKRAFNLNGVGRLLDLGCGTGQLALPLAPLFKEVVAMDSDGAMLAEGAAGCRARNVRWRQGSSADLASLAPDLGRFRLVTIGRAFHWMDRDQTLTDLYNLIEPDGGLAILGDGEPIWSSGEVPKPLPPPRSGEASLARQHTQVQGANIQNPVDGRNLPLPSHTWQSAVREVVQDFLGQQRRAGPHLFTPPTEHHEAVLARSKFTNLQRTEFNYQRTWTPDHLVGYLLSTSYASPALLGDNSADFQHAVREALSTFTAPLSEAVTVELLVARRG